jgi:DNA ligase-1
MYSNGKLTMLCHRKFFGKPNGASSKPQQSKLSFSTSSKVAKKDEQPTEEPKSSAEPLSEKEDANDGADAKIEANVDAMEVDSKLAVETGKKRQVKEEEEDSEDEPPTKRQRRKPAKAEPEMKKVTKAETKTTKPETKPKATPKKAAKGPTKVRKVDPEVEVEEELEHKKKVEESPAKESELEEEEDDVLSSDAEPPALKQKAREKVQATLKAKAKDPYPDWKPGEPVPFAALCTTFSKIEMTTKRLEILAHCSLFLRQVLRLTPSDLVPTILLMINKLAADYAGIELGIGESLIQKAISESTGRSLQHIKTDHNEIGDLGLVAAKSRSKQPTMFKPKALTVAGVHKGLISIATIEGQGAQGRKVDNIKKLLSAADADKAGKAVDIEKDKGGPSESKYIVRMLEGKLRLGLADKTVLVALSQAVIFHEIEQQGKTPTTADLAKAESTLKSVYR